MITERQKIEYDQFGPWILEITGKDEIPPIFEPYFSMTDSVLLAFKIPIGMERRLAKAGMDLYDYLIAFYEDYILICKRSNNSVLTQQLYYSDILYIRNFLDLLYGELIFYLNDSSISIHYNSVSSDIINTCIDITRQRYNRIIRTMNLKHYNPLDVVDVILYRNLSKSITEKQDMYLISFQPGVPVNFPGASFFGKLFGIKVPMQVQPSMVFASNTELLLVDRTVALKQKSRTEYGYQFAHIPFGSIQKIKDNGPSSYHVDGTMKNLEITTGSHVIQCFMSSDQNLNELIRSVNVSNDIKMTH